MSVKSPDYSDVNFKKETRDIVNNPYWSQYYSRAQRKWVEMIIKPTKKIGFGNFGEVYEVLATIGNRDKRFIIKRPIVGPVTYMSEEEIELYQGYSDMGERIMNDRSIALCSSELKGYRTARDAGLKVFPTCRYTFGEHGAELLISSGFDEHHVCVGDKGESAYLSHFGHKQIENIHNIESVLSGMLHQATLGYRAGLHIGADVYFFLVDTTTLDKIDYVVGDPGPLYSENENKNLLSLFEFNVDHVQMAMSQFVENNILEGNRAHYLEMIKSTCKLFKEQSKLTPDRIIRQERLRRIKRFLLHGY